MMTNLWRHPWRLAALLVVVAVGLLLGVADRPLVDYWLTPDQQGQRLEASGDHLAAANRYQDPLRRGIALYRGRDFESAAALFGTLNAPEAAFNRGNALVMLGRYPEAMESYDLALAARPDWPEARDNRELARLRQIRREAGGPEEGGASKIGADEVVFSEQSDQDSGEQTATDGGESMNAAQVEALWMRRLQTSPADFLRAKFSYQLMMQGQEAMQ